MPENYPQQEPELIYALDIGTRSVIGLLGRRVQDRVHILAVEKQDHTKRAMLDGQIEDIEQVAEVVRAVTERLEQTSRRHLTRACVAAAGRALRTETGSSKIELTAPEAIRRDRVSELELSAVSAAEKAIRTGQEGERQRLFLVGYTVTRTLLDGYPLASLAGHTGQNLEASVVATFLPSGVVDSLYAVMRASGLEVASLTLEPIAALNAAIPADLRLLNLALVDIGAGTSDIAICRDGSVVGYTMATVAGDEITEALMKSFLVDFSTAEQIKRGLAGEEEVVFSDILGIEYSMAPAELLRELEPNVNSLAEEIARQVLELNGGVAPSAMFLAGGGSKLANFADAMARAMEMDRKRITVAGRYFQASAYADDIQLNDPEYTTPLGIAVSTGLGLINDSYQVELNGHPARLFRSGSLTALELLMMNGYTYGDLISRSGRNLAVTVDGRRQAFYGEPGVPAVLRVNGREVQPSVTIQTGDQIEFIPAKQGKDRIVTAGELALELGVEGLLQEGERLEDDAVLAAGAALTSLPKIAPAAPVQAAPAAPVTPVQAAPAAPVTPVQAAPAAPVTPVQAAPAAPVTPVQAAPAAPVTPVQAAPAKPAAPALVVRLNGRMLALEPKPDGAPYYLMDLLDRSGIDFKHTERPVILSINGKECSFQQMLAEGDEVVITDEAE